MHRVPDNSVNQIFENLICVLNSIPNGFPKTRERTELKLLKKIFEPEHAVVFCRLKLIFEEIGELEERIGIPIQDLRPILEEMKKRGQITYERIGNRSYVKMKPWLNGIYGAQIGRMDQEFAKLNQKYWKVYERHFNAVAPPRMQTIPIEKEIETFHTTFTYERISQLIANNRSFLLQDCICKKERMLAGYRCERPVRVCIRMSPLKGFFDKTNPDSGSKIDREEAYRIIAIAEKNALVHMTNNVQCGHTIICNCCSCCCPLLRSINEIGLKPKDVIHSRYYAEIDNQKCKSCRTCIHKRCQIKAIKEKNGKMQVESVKCIGCGLCVSTCESNAIKLKTRQYDKRRYQLPPADEKEWFKRKGKNRNIDYSSFL